MDERVKELQVLLARSRRYRPKSTENIFVKWVDIAKAFGVCKKTAYTWSKQLPPLPLTRQYLERWLREREPRVMNDRLALRVLEYRVIRKRTDTHVMKALGIGHSSLHRLWKRALRDYDKLRMRSKFTFPVLRQDAEDIWNKRLRGVARRKFLKYNRKRRHK